MTVPWTALAGWEGASEATGDRNGCTGQMHPAVWEGLRYGTIKGRVPGFVTMAEGAEKPPSGWGWLGGVGFTQELRKDHSGLHNP